MDNLFHVDRFPERLDDDQYHDLIETVAAGWLKIDLEADRAQRGTKTVQKGGPYDGKTVIDLGNLDLEDEVLRMKQLVIQALPHRFSTWEAHGHERIASQGQYRLIGPIPRDEVIEVLARRGYLNVGPPAEER